MTSTDLIDAVSEDLRILFRDYRLLNKAGAMQEVRVFPQYMPQPSGITFNDKKTGIKNYSESDYEANFPGIIVKLGSIIDNEESRLDINKVEVRLLIGVYDDTAESQGYRDVLGMMDMIREHYLKNRIISRRYKIEMPLTSALIDADTYPVYFGEVKVIMLMGRPVQGVDYIYRGYLRNG